jgi:hypothetical protein
MLPLSLVLAGVTLSMLGLAFTQSSSSDSDQSIPLHLTPDSGAVDTTRSVTLTPAQGALVPLLAAASDTARRRSLTPVLDIGATWCGPCQTLNDLLASADMRPVVNKMYLIHLDLDVWHDALDSLGVDVNTGIPRLQALSGKSLPTGEPWRPRDVPERTEEGWRASIRDYFAHAKKLFTDLPVEDRTMKK